MLKLQFLPVLLLSAAGCLTHRVEVAPIEVKPIHITMDVNIKVDRELDSFFSAVEQQAGVKPPATSGPTTRMTAP